MSHIRETIHLIFKTHLDIGFTDYAKNVFQTYFDVFIPSAIQTARELKERGSQDRFIWTTGSWLIYEYLEQADTAKRKHLEQAIEAGDIVWHGLPFTTHTELMTGSLFKHGLSLSHTLDQRFSKTTLSAKMTDVPGHTRGIVPLLADAGIRFLHLGSNEASTPPDVPSTFVWHDLHSQTKLTVMYQKGGYGGLIRIPGFNHVLAFAHTNDNHGAQSTEEVQTIFQKLRTKYPDAQVIGSTMDAFAKHLTSVPLDLPIITQEIGDTWIQGVGSDPLKVSQYRELVRLREEWLASGKIQPTDRRLIAFSNKLILIPEHTWGMDEKVHLKNNTDYTRSAFEAARQTPPFQRFEASWSEQRAYLNEAIDALGGSAQAAEATARLAAIRAKRPNKRDFDSLEINQSPFATPHFQIGFDPITGAINHLVHNQSSRQWAANTHPLALFRYQTFSENDYAYYWKHYIVNKRSTKRWSWDDNMKPGMENAGAKSRFWLPSLKNLSVKTDSKSTSFLLELDMEAEATTFYGSPKVVFIVVTCSHDKPVLSIDLQWFNKPANRLPEAIWFSFKPVTHESGKWSMNKLGVSVSPLDVIRNGNRKLHAVEDTVWYQEPRHKLAFETLDAVLVAPGDPSLLHFNNAQPTLRNGIHFNLLNNVWGTNFPMWYEDDTRFRFKIRIA